MCRTVPRPRNKRSKYPSFLTAVAVVIETPERARKRVPGKADRIPQSLRVDLALAVREVQVVTLRRSGCCGAFVPPDARCGRPSHRRFTGLRRSRSRRHSGRSDSLHLTEASAAAIYPRHTETSFRFAEHARAHDDDRYLFRLYDSPHRGGFIALVTRGSVAVHALMIPPRHVRGIFLP
jgi:hypothetical protein